MRTDSSLGGSPDLMGAVASLREATLDRLLPEAALGQIREGHIGIEFNT
jgi:hypothetical protein